MNKLSERLRMDRRRLECAHIRYTVLKIVQWYPADLKAEEIVFHSHPSSTLLEFTPIYQKLFHHKYSGKCNYCIM